jgi:hypothetical protein
VVMNILLRFPPQVLKTARMVVDLRVEISHVSSLHHGVNETESPLRENICRPKESLYIAWEAMWCKVFHECTLIYGCSSRAATRSWGTSSSQQSDWRTDKPKFGHVPISGALGKSTAICRNPAGRHQCSSRWIMLLQCHENASLAVSYGNPYCMLILSGPSCHTEKGFFWLRRGGSRQ